MICYLKKGISAIPGPSAGRMKRVGEHHLAMLNAVQCVGAVSQQQQHVSRIGQGISMSLPRKLVFYSDTDAAANQQIDERLLRLINRPHPRIGYIAAVPDPERIYFDAQRKRYQGMGAELVVYADQETVHGGEDEATLLACDAIHLSGGNTFAFLHWLKRSPLMELLPHYVAQGGVLIGVSAGAMLLTPGIACAELCGDSRNRLPPDDNALGLVDFNFWPHYRSGQVLSPMLAKWAHELPSLVCCPDGCGIVVDGERIEHFGATASIAKAGRAV